MLVRSKLVAEIIETRKNIVVGEEMSATVHRHEKTVGVEKTRIVTEAPCGLQNKER